MTLIASGTGHIEFFLRMQAEGNSQCEQTIFIYTISARSKVMILVLVLLSICTVGVKIKFPLRIRSTCVEQRNVITIEQRYAKSTVITLG